MKRTGVQYLKLGCENKPHGVPYNLFIKIITHEKL